jgi:hypothetical protein
VPKEAQLPTQSLSKAPVRSPYSNAFRAAASIADAILRPIPVPQVVPFTNKVELSALSSSQWVRAYFEHQTYRRDYDLGLGMISGNRWVERDSCTGCARWFAMLESLVRPGKPEKEDHSLCVLSMSRFLFVSEYSRVDMSRVDVLSGMPSFIPSQTVVYISHFLCRLAAKR